MPAASQQDAEDADAAALATSPLRRHFAAPGLHLFQPRFF